MNDGLAEAKAVLASATESFQDLFGTRLVATYALGSLAHGGFSAMVSDIDLGVIIDDPIRSGDSGAIRAIVNTESRKRSPFSDRLSVFWGTQSTLGGQGKGGRFPAFDRLDLIEYGQLLSGTEIRSRLPRPTGSELLTAGAEFALDFLVGAPHPGSTVTGHGAFSSFSGHDAVKEMRSPDLLLAAGVRRLTKLVLFPARFLFTATTGQVATNDAAAAWYLDFGDSQSAPLVGAALAWRKGTRFDGQVARELLREQVVPLYLYFIDDHVARLGALGQVELARKFEDWRSRLVS